MPFHFPDRKILPHDRPLWLGHGENYFLTLCCHERSANQLCRPEVAAVVFESLAFRQARGDWYPHLCLLMPEHLHALVHLPSDRQLRHVVEDWERLIASKAGIAWQRGFFAHRLRREESFHRKAEYVRQNPCRAGLVRNPEEWPYVWRPPG